MGRLCNVVGVDIWEIFVSSQFSCKPNTTLKDTPFKNLWIPHSSYIISHQVLLNLLPKWFSNLYPFFTYTSAYLSRHVSDSPLCVSPFMHTSHGTGVRRFHVTLLCLYISFSCETSWPPFITQLILPPSKKTSWGLPWWSRGEDFKLPMQGAQIQPLVRELRSHMPQCSA